MKAESAQMQRSPVNVRSQSHCVATIIAVDTANVDIKVDQERCKQCSGACLMRLLGAADTGPVSLARSHFSSSRHQLPNQSPNQLLPGKRVEVSFSTGLLLGLSAVVYLVPVFVMLLFALGSSLAAPDSEILLLFAIIVGLALGLLGSNLLVRLFEASAKRSLVCCPIE